MISYVELENGLFEGKELAQIVPKEAYGYIPYVDDKVMENRGFYAVLTTNGVAIMPIDATGLKKDEMKLAQEETIQWMNNQLTAAIVKYEETHFLTNEVARFLEGGIAVEDMHFTVDSLIIAETTHDDVLDFYDENGQVIFPNDETYHRFYAIWKKEESLLLECIEWTNVVLDFYTRHPAKNERKENIELLDILSWTDAKTNKRADFLIIQNATGKINLIHTRTGVAYDEEFESTSELLTYFNENETDKNEIHIASKEEWVIYFP